MLIQTRFYHLVKVEAVEEQVLVQDSQEQTANSALPVARLCSIILNNPRPNPPNKIRRHIN